MTIIGHINPIELAIKDATDTATLYVSFKPWPTPKHSQWGWDMIMNYMPLGSIWVHLRLLVGSVLLIFLVFCVVLCFVVFSVVVLFVFVLCPILQVSMGCLFLIIPSVFSNVYLFCLSSSCVLCTQCFRCLWIVHYWLSLRFSLMFIYLTVFFEKC